MMEPLSKKALSNSILELSEEGHKSNLGKCDFRFPPIVNEPARIDNGEWHTGSWETTFP